MERADIVIIGAGVIGLSIARQLADDKSQVIVFEKNRTFGQETSSRNSEVIHSGTYYPKDSLKARLCVEGRHMLYKFCNKYDIPHKQLGKLIVATSQDEITELEHLANRGRDNGVDDLEFLDKNQIKKLEPNVEGFAAIYSPSTGIFDVHSFMKSLHAQAESRGAIFVYSCEVTGITRTKAGYEVACREESGELTKVACNTVINCAGLFSEKIAQMAGIDTEKRGYKLYYCKGEYFRLSAKKSKMVQRLIYPAPHYNSLGIHTVPDMQGQVKLGPNAFYVDDINYDVDPAHAKEFFGSAKKFLPFIEQGDLKPDTAGIRPKLQGPDGQFRDFVIEREKDLPRFINLMGIESPGLTSSLSLAKYVENMI